MWDFPWLMKGRLIGREKNMCIPIWFSFSLRRGRLDDKTVAASLRNGNKGVLPVRSSLPSWKTLISAKSANYFECVPDRVRIKIRPDRFWPGGPRKIPNAETNWTLSQSEVDPIQRRTRSNSNRSERRINATSSREYVYGPLPSVSGRGRIWNSETPMAFCLPRKISAICRERSPSNSVLQICQLFRDKSWIFDPRTCSFSSMFRLVICLQNSKAPLSPIWKPTIYGIIQSFVLLAFTRVDELSLFQY